VFASLIDRGANGEIAGDDMRLICFDRDRTINVQGIDNHQQLPHLKIGTFGAVKPESVLQITDGCHGHSIMTQGEAGLGP
jgi:hypothetical protein